MTFCRKTRRRKKMRKSLVLLLSLGLLGLATVAPAQAGDIRTERVQFPKGKTGTTIRGRIKGYETLDYKLRARAGQHMTVALETDSSANYFNVLAPGESEVAFFIGSNDGNRFEGDLPESGDYTIRVYLYRNAARRGEKADYRLKITIAAGGKAHSDAGGTSAAGPSPDDALVPGTEFHATGDIPCARYEGQPMGSCRFGVIRRGGGSATVRVFWADGGARNLYFEDGKLTSTDSEAGVHTERVSDLNKVFVGTEERFEIPDAVIYGG
jgi:hypothetical protein